MKPDLLPWSCDSFAVSAPHTAHGATILGKNSDRPARESQPLKWLNSRRGNTRLQLAYVEIEDVEGTIAHLGSSPYWCWGHEMGLNTHGVAIGNEALFTRDLAASAAEHRSGVEVQPGILGMELLRIALERAETAHAAVDVMTHLVEQYGQWGAGTVNPDRAAAAYDNSYLIADAAEVWILETSGHGWVTKKVEDSMWSLSNEPTIRADWTQCSTDLESYARDRGWWDQAGRLDFAETFTDPYTPLQISHIRLQRSRQLLADALKTGPVSFHEARRVLSDHYEGSFLEGPKFNPARPDFHTLCMHDHPAGFTWGNTATSTIAVLPSAGRPYMWWAAATPCTSVYIPVTPGSGGLPQSLSRAGVHHAAGPNPEAAENDSAAADSYWWTFQQLLETVTGETLGTSYFERQPVVRARFDQLQAQWLDAVEELTQANASEEAWTALTSRCVDESQRTAHELIQQLRTT